MIVECKLTNQRSFRCHCETCVQSLGPLNKKLGKLWQAQYGEQTKAFHKRIRRYHDYVNFKDKGE